MDYVESDPQILDLGRIAGIVDTIDQARRMKWATQIEEILNGFHDVGIFWGDAKAFFRNAVAKELGARLS